MAETFESMSLAIAVGLLVAIICGVFAYSALLRQDMLIEKLQQRIEHLEDTIRIFENIEEHHSELARSYSFSNPRKALAIAHQTSSLYRKYINSLCAKRYKHLDDYTRRIICDEIVSSSIAYGFDPIEIFSLIEHESGFNPRAVSRCGALGLSQCMPHVVRSYATAAGVAPPGWQKTMENVKKLAFDPIASIKIGVCYLNGKRIKHPNLYLIAYNGGDGAVRKYLRGMLSSRHESVRYYKGVMSSWKRNSVFLYGG